MKAIDSFSLEKKDVHTYTTPTPQTHCVSDFKSFHLWISRGSIDSRLKTCLKAVIWKNGNSRC